MRNSRNGRASAVLTYTQLAIAQHVPVQMTIAESPPRSMQPSCWAPLLAVARRDYSGMTMATRALLRRDFTYAMRMVRDAMTADQDQRLAGLIGQAIRCSAGLARLWHAISSHVVMNSGRGRPKLRPHGSRSTAAMRLSRV